MSEAIFGLFGTGGCARSIMPFVPEALERALGPQAGGLSIVFVDREPGPDVNGVPVMSEADFLAHGGPRHFNVGIAEPALRRRLADMAMAAGATPVTLVASGARIYQPSLIGEGSVLCEGTIVTVNVEIGRFTHLNLQTYVEHDCRIGDFVTFAPAVHCNGAVDIGDNVYIGAGASIRQGRPDAPLRIGPDATVGMGAVVLNDVPAGVTVVGNPAKPLVQKESRRQP